MEKLYVLAGKARSGKDSVADLIEKNCSFQKVLKYSCTMYLKKYISLLYGFDCSLDDKPRDLLQDFGKKIKDIYPMFFIDRMRDDIKFLSSYCDVLIITGVRLVDELKFLKNEYDGFLIKVINDSDNNLTFKQKNDITETDVDNYNSYDYIINNNGDISDLEDKVKKLLEV